MSSFNLLSFTLAYHTLHTYGLSLIGVSLSKPHTSVIALHTRVCIWPAMLAWTDHLPEILNLRIYKNCTCMCTLQIQIWFWKWSWSPHHLPQWQWIYWVRGRDCILNERKGILPGCSIGTKETKSRNDLTWMHCAWQLTFWTKVRVWSDRVTRQATSDPGDTLASGMRLAWPLIHNRDSHVSSWLDCEA